MVHAQCAAPALPTRNVTCADRPTWAREDTCAASLLNYARYVQEHYIRDAIGSPLLPSSLMPQHAVIICEECFHAVSKLTFKIYLVRPSLMFESETIAALYSGNEKFAQGLQTYLLSRDYSNLKSEFQLGNGKIKVDCIENQPEVDVSLGQHLFLTAGDLFLRKKTG
ncbi:isoleucine--tRNA ligase, cytoplasmic-like [Carica papaya]|uniref:isoleucine--tRNA ligase, cytoplasmic-like n=1 Tax=Carica papaya TaxID=3649 RepID=UPI000B8CEFF5|nr:isoleucine--tRNA ligase, cytoplasmic-like [Carica papaya]